MIKKIILVPFLRVLGVNVEHFFALYSIKMKMDFRRTPGTLQGSGGKKQTFGKQIIMYVVIGLVMLPLLFAVKDPKVSFSIFFAMIMVLTGSTMLVEFTSVLFDENENYILLPRPISSRTLLVTRLAHIMTYISIITYSMSFPAAIFILIEYGISFFPFVISVFLASMFTLLNVVGFYMAMAHLVNGEKFKDIINYFQIALTVVILGGYQILPRMFDIEGIGNISLPNSWWIYLVPPVWFAGLTDLFIDNITGADIVLSVIAISASLAGALVVVRILSSNFSAVLSQNSVVSSKKEKHKNTNGKERGVLNFVSKIICVSKMERQGWSFANNVTKRDRKFKQQVYPMIAYAVIMSVIMLMPDFKNLDNFWQDIAGSKKYLAFIFIGFMCVVASSMLPFTDTPDASWIYKIARPKNSNHIHSGALKLIIFKFFSPIYLFLIGFTFYVWGFKEAIYILIGALLTVLWAVLGIIMQKQPLPFSLHRDMLRKGGYTGRMIISMLMMGVIIGLVYVVTLLPIWVSYAILLLVSGLIPLAYSQIRKRKNIRILVPAT